MTAGIGVQVQQNEIVLRAKHDQIVAIIPARRLGAKDAFLAARRRC